MSATAGQLHTGELATAGLFGALEDPALNSMNFLNEISSRYPEAISLAAGRPVEQFFEVESLDRYLRRFCQHLEADLGYSPVVVDIAEFEKLEGCVTCLSVLVPGRGLA